jgi:beta-fructofuranosidase
MVGIVGVEGGKTRPHAQAYAKANPDRPKRDPRYCNWFFANLTTEDNINFNTTGMIDWGDWYAPNVFAHPDGRRIAWGWIVEQDISDELAKEKGWIGCLGIPRELSLGVYSGVTGTTKTPLNAITSIEKAGDQVIVLSIRPLRELENLRQEVLYASSSVTSGTLLDKAPHSYEILVRADIREGSTVSVAIRESSKVKTTITFDSQQERLIINRGGSTTREGICLQDEVAPFTLFRYGDTYEQLELRVFVDNDVVEVFANERVAISTRVYAPRDACGISLEVDAPGTADVKVWSMGSIGLQDG